MDRAKASHKTPPDRLLDRSCLVDKIGQNPHPTRIPRSFDRRRSPSRRPRIPARISPGLLSAASPLSAGSGGRAVRSRCARITRRTTTRGKSQARSPVCCTAQQRQRATHRSPAEAPNSMRERSTTRSRRRCRPPRLAADPCLQRLLRLLEPGCIGQILGSARGPPWPATAYAPTTRNSTFSAVNAFNIPAKSQFIPRLSAESPRCDGERPDELDPFGHRHRSIGIGLRLPAPSDPFPMAGGDAGIA